MLLLHVPSKFSARKKKFFLSTEKNEIFFIRKIGVRLLGVCPKVTHTLLPDGLAAPDSGCDRCLHAPVIAHAGAQGRTREHSAQEQRRRRTNPAGSMGGPSLGPGQTERCDFPLSSAEAADPKCNSGLEKATVLGKGNYLW